jgi:hypothetical protein
MGKLCLRFNAKFGGRQQQTPTCSHGEARPETPATKRPDAHRHQPYPEGADRVPGRGTASLYRYDVTRRRKGDQSSRALYGPFEVKRDGTLRTPF